MRKRNKRIILAVVFVGLAYFVTRPMHYPDDNRVISQSNSPITQELNYKSVEISFDEMNKFLALWSEYLTKRMGRAGGYQISLSNKELKDSLPRKTVKWIEDNGWEVKRFFYVEQRLRSIVKSATLKMQAKDSREVLEKQLAETRDPSTVQSIMKLMEEQKNLYKVENVTEEEINMITPHLSVVRDILNGKVIFRPGPNSN